MFCANQDRPTKRGPKPKVHYLCLVCLAQLSERDVRTHHRDCFTTMADLKAFIDEIAAGGWKLDADGMLPIPDRPGLGIEVDLEALAELSVDDSCRDLKP